MKDTIEVTEDKKDYLSPAELVAYCSKDKRTIKMVTSDVEFNSNLVIRDISLVNKGDDEDKVFGEHPFLHKNIRRGNSVLETINSDKKVEECIILRKGLKKFFDVYLEYLDVEEAETSSTWVCSNKHFTNLKALTIDTVEKSFADNESQIIHIYQLGKANGENAQISYVSKYDAWAVSSKNVCALIQSAKDLTSYDAQRYSFSMLIGQTWMQYIDQLEKKDSSLLKQLKLYMDGKTFVGEYCGNQDFQHLVKYNEINLHFYAIVENTSIETCIPPEEAYAIFNKYGMQAVSLEKFTSSSWQEYNQIILKLYKKVGQSPIEEYGEGAVLYFVEELPHQRVVSLCKLKTLEYRIFRKLREKLKNCLADKRGSSGKWLKKFTKEVQELCEFCQPAKEQDYYFSIATAAFDFIDSPLGESYKNLISSKYITFLDMIIASVEKNITINLTYLKESFAKSTEGDENTEDADSSELNILKLHKNSRIVIITPPFYLSEELKKTIVNSFKVKAIGQSWKEGHANTDLLAIDNIHMIPRITAEKLNRNNYFIIAGWCDKRMEYLKQQIEEIKNEDPKEYNFEEKSYLKSNSIKKQFVQNINKIKELKASAKTVLPKNIQFIDDFFIYSLDESPSVEEDEKKKKQKLILIEESKSNDELIQSLIQGFQHFLYGEKQRKQIEQDKKDQEFSQNEAEGQEEEEQKAKDEESNQDDEDLKSKKTHKKQNPPLPKIKKDLLILVPLTIPATGKTTFFKKIFQHYKESKEIKVHYISSDEIRKQLMDEKRAENKSLTEEDLFNKTAKPAKNRFESILTSMLEDIEDHEISKHILILDKNHPTSAIESTIPFLKEITPKKVSLKIIALLPQIITPYSSDRSQYPYSLTYLLNCMSRCLNRETHETLIGDPIKQASVIFLFFSLFKNIQFTPASLNRQGFNDFIKVQFHHETKDSDSTIKPRQLKTLEQTLKSFKIKEAESSPYLSTFIEEFYAQPVEYEEVEFNKQLAEFQVQINKLLS